MALTETSITTRDLGGGRIYVTERHQSEDGADTAVFVWVADEHVDIEAMAATRKGYVNAARAEEEFWRIVNEALH